MSPLPDAPGAASSRSHGLMVLCLDRSGRKLWRAAGLAMNPCALTVARRLHRAFLTYIILFLGPWKKGGVPYQDKTRLCRTGPYGLKWVQPQFRVRCIRPISNSRSAGADQVVGRRASSAGVRRSVRVAGPITPTPTFRPLGIGGRQDRGIRLKRGAKLTGIRQGKSRRRIRIMTQNQ
jgi:hypothetical protein